MRQHPNITMAVDCDVKHQYKQTNIEKKKKNLKLDLSVSKVIYKSFMCNRLKCGSEAQLAECSQEALGSNPKRATFIFGPCDIWWPV